MLAEELPNARFVRARSILEWRFWPERLNHEAGEWAREVWAAGRRAAAVLSS